MRTQRLAFLSLIGALIAPLAGAQYARVSMTTLAAHAFLPELGAPPGMLSPVDNELVAIAGEVRNGRFRTATERLDAIELRLADARDRFMTMLVRRELHRFRISLVGGSLPSGGDLLLEGLANWNDGAKLQQLSSALSPSELHDAVIAEKYLGGIFWALSGLPTLRRMQTQGFGTPQESLQWFETYRRDTASLPDLPRFLSQRDRTRIDRLIDGIDAAAADAPDRAASHFRSALEGQSGPAAFAIMLRIGDAYAFPSGDALTGGVDTASVEYLVMMFDAGQIPKFGLTPTEERRRIALDWYRCAAAVASSVPDDRAIRYRLLVISDTQSPESILRLEELAEESDDLTGWASLAAVAFGYGRPSAMSDAIAGALRQDAIGAAVSFASWIGAMARSVATGSDNDFTITVLESATRATSASRLDGIVGVMMGVLAVKYRETGRYSAGVVAARLGVERQTRFVTACEAAAATLSPPVPADSLAWLLAEQQAILGRLILEWRMSLSAIDDQPALAPNVAEQAWNAFVRDVLPRLDEGRQRQLLQMTEPYGSMALAIRLTRLLARGESACAEMMPLAADVRRMLLANPGSRSRAYMLKLDVAMFICDEQPLRRDYQDIITDDVLQPVRTALADPSRQTNVQNEVALVLEKLAVLRMMKAWPLLGRWATEAEELGKRDPRLRALDLYGFVMRAESLRGGGQADEAVALIRTRLEPSSDELEDVAGAVLSAWLLAGAQQCDCGLASCDPVVTAALWQMAMKAYSITARSRSGVTDRERSSAEQASLEMRLATQPTLDPAEVARVGHLQEQRAGLPETAYWDATSTQSLYDVVDSLPPRVTLLQYAIAEDDLIVWVFRRGVVRMEHLVGVGRRVTSNAKELQNDLLDAMNDRWRTLAAELSRDLIDPIGPLPDGEVLLIVADGVLARTPFDILQKRDGVSLGETHPTVLLERVVTMTDDPRDEPRLGEPVVIGVNGDGIAAAEMEAQKVAAILGTKPRLGNVVVDEVLAAFGNAPIIHIAAHTRITPENPFDSHLSLGGGRRLTAWELFRHAPAAELITLSACDTAMESRFDAAITTQQGPSSSLVSFAFSGGARFALSSLWTASDAVTAELMARFYTAVAQGTDVVHALHQAKRAMRRSMHPHYFANFTLTGRNVAVVTSRLHGVK